MAPLQVGSTFPDGVKFEWVPIQDDDPTKCGRPQEYDASKEFKGKKVVLVSVPGAFTPTCQANHIPPFIEQAAKFREKGVDIIAVIASNDAWVMAAWAKVNKLKDDTVLFLSDTNTQFSKSYGWQAGGGDRNGRWAMMVEKDGKISYVENEPNPSDVTVSGAGTILSRL